MKPIISICFGPRRASCKDYHTVESRLGGIGLVELVVPVGQSLSPRTLHDLKAVEDQIGQIKVTDPEAIAQVLSLATVLDPDGRLAALAADRQDRLLADKLELIAASPQEELLRSFWNAEAGETRILIRLKEQMPAPDKSRIFREATAAAVATFGPTSYLTGLSFLMTRTTEAIIATQWGTFLWSAIGILLMLTLAFRSVILAFLAIMPTLLSVALVLGLMGWLRIQLDMATALVASVALGLSVDDTFHCLLQFHRQRKRRFRQRLFESYRVSGPGVVLSSVAVAIGFAALRASEFEPFVNFGTMVGIATAGSTLGNLVFLPACLTLGERLRSNRHQGRASDRCPRSRSNDRSASIHLMSENAAARRCHLLGRHVLDMRRDMPVMTKGVFQAAGSVTVELIFHRPHELRTRGDRPFHRIVDVVNVEQHPHRRAADRPRAACPHFGELVGEHNA